MHFKKKKNTNNIDWIRVTNERENEEENSSDCEYASLIHFNVTCVWGYMCRCKSLIPKSWFSSYSIIRVLPLGILYIDNNW